MKTEIENNISATSILKKINSHLDNKRKKEVKLVFSYSLLSSLAESVSLVMLIPFVSFFVNPDDYIFNSFFLFFLDFFNITSQKNILAAVSFGFIFLVLISAFIRLKFIRTSNGLTDNLTSDFRIKIFKFLINQNFSYFFKHGSNEIMSNLTQKTDLFFTIIFSIITIINSILITSAVVFVLIINEPFYTPLIMSAIIIFFLFNYKIKSASITRKGMIINKNRDLMVDIFQNAVGYLPEIIVYNIRKLFVANLSKISKEIALYSANAKSVALSPKIYLETFAIIFVIFIVYFSNFSERALEVNISYLAILTYGTQKCLPLINNVYNFSIIFRNVAPSVSGFLRILDDGNKKEISDREYDVLKFEKKIKIENLSYRYDQKLPNILNKINFDITKGEKIAIKGQTGSGKSTLVNIISGLINPSQGEILVDGTLINSENIKNWQKNIAIVPQTVFLTDASILENIAITVDVDSIDIEKVKYSAKIAQIDSFINSLPNKYYEKVGERGVRLSGGQRQRMGIARALYREAKLIILDEPTNALDTETEKLVMDSISKLSKDITLIMISHSDTSLKYFDKTIDLNKFK